MDNWSGFAKDNQGTEVEFKKFLLLIITCVLDIMQKDLKLAIKLFYSRDQDEIFCKIKASEHNYQVQADLIDYLLQLKRRPEDKKEGWSLICPYGPFEKSRDASDQPSTKSLIYSKKVIEKVEQNYKVYDSNEHQAKDGSGSTLFKYKDKVRILLAMINSAIDMGELIDNDILIKHYCLHNEEKLQDLKETWGSFGIFYKRQPLQKIRNYYGEKIAMYFSWLEYYIFWLSVPALLGFATFIIKYATDDVNGNEQSMNISEISLLIFSLTLALGSTLLDQLWVRRQIELSWMWGTVDMNEVEQQRPTYKGKYSTDPVTGRKKKISERSIFENFKKSIGLSVVFLFIGSVIVAVTGIMLYRAQIKNTQYGLELTALMNALQIKILNAIYRRVAKFFTDWENYEYDTQYNDALCIKLYLFQFINSYASLFYIGFIKCYGDEDNGTCLDELSLQLAIIFSTNVIFNSFELGYPYILNKWRSHKERNNLVVQARSGAVNREDMTSTEAQAQLAEYETPLDDYMELIIDYGYVVMFSASFPIIPLIAFMVNVIEVRVDAYKLCHLMRRPYPAPANSIGEWEGIVRTISVIGALTNTSIIIFTANIFGLENFADKWTYFMVIEHILLIFKFLLSRQMPDVPNDVKKGIIWSERVANERIYGKSSDVDEQKKLRKLFFKEVYVNDEEGKEKALKLDPDFIANSDN